MQNKLIFMYGKLCNRILARQEIKILNRPKWAVLILTWGRWRDTPEHSAWRIRENTIIKILKNRPNKIFLIFIIAYRGQEFISATKIKRPIWAFYFCVGVAVWTKYSQSAITGFGASVDENEPFGEVWILRSERGPLRQCGANGNQTIPSSPPQKSNAQFGRSFILIIWPCLSNVRSVY